MKIKTVLDIDPEDAVIRNLAEIANFFDLMDMQVVVAIMGDVSQYSGMRVPLAVTPQNAQDIIRIFLAMAVVNYGSWKHEILEIMVETAEGFTPVTFTRNSTPEEHKLNADNYMKQIARLIIKYMPPGKIL